MRPRLALGFVPLALLLAGCTAPAEKTPAKGGDRDEAEVRQVFTDFQAALKQRDGARLWDLLAEDSRQDADRRAKGLKDDFAKADEAKRAEMEKNLELPAHALPILDGKGYLKSKQFFGKYHEVPDSKLKDIAVKGDKAQLNYVEEDGDEERLQLVREQGHWKLLVEMPK
jgi:hypothetical protein